MAERGKPIDAGTKARIERLTREGRPKREVARMSHVSVQTAYKYSQAKRN